MTHLCCTWMLPILIVVKLASKIYTNPIHYHKDIVNPGANYFRDVLNITRSDVIKIKYNIAFRKEKCCPYIVFRCNEVNWAYGYTHTCKHDNPLYLALYSPLYILTSHNLYGSKCHVENGYHRCEGKRTLTALSPSEWSVVASYYCKDGSFSSRKNLDLTIDLEIEYFTDYTFPCEPVNKGFCRIKFGLNYTALPNALSQPTQLDIEKTLDIVHSFEPLSKCYQHSALLACRSLYPSCHRDHKRLIPCRQMCQDAIKGCEQIFRRLHQPVICTQYPDILDPDVCFYKPIKCPKPNQPEFGHIITIGVLLGNTTRCICDEGYEIQGDSARHCKHSGLWNSTEPLCTPKGKYPHLVLFILLPILGLFLVIIALVILCVYNRENIHLLFWHKRRIEERNTIHEVQPRKKLFVTYSSEDKDEVSGNFIPEVRNELAGWDVITYQEDFVPGRPLMDCIKEGVWDSQAVLVLLTANFISSPMCLFEFIQAEKRSVIDNEFRMIVVLFTKDRNKAPADLATDFPENLKEYVHTRIYLHLREPLFWNKLRRSLLTK